MSPPDPVRPAPEDFQRARDRRQIEQRRGRRAVLTALGQRLLGLQRWGEA